MENQTTESIRTETVSARHAAQYRSWLRQQASVGTYRCPVVAVPGKAAPRTAGEAGYHTTPSGKTIVRHPGAYGYRTWYHCSTLRVEVGVAWLAARGIPVAAVRA